MLTGFHHAQITVPPGVETRARAFYCDLLGLPEVRKPASLARYGGFWVAVGDRSLHVGEEAEAADRPLTRAHLAFEVTDAAAWRETLADAGLEIIDQPDIPGFERFHFLDPWGNRLELIQAVD